MEDRLKKFAKLVDLGSFTRASKDLHISQPALSMAISKLEKEVGAELIVRNSHSLQLTEAGNIAYLAAKEVDTVAKNLSIQVSELMGKRPAVNIGMIDSIANALFSKSENINVLEEQADISVVVNNTRYLTNAIQRNQLDIAFVVEKQTSQPSSLDSKYLASEPLVVVCHAKNAKAIQTAVSQKKLPNFMSYDQASSTRMLVDDALKSKGLTPDYSFYSTSPEVMLRLLLLKKGVAALPYSLVKGLIAENTLSLIGTNSPIIIDRRICVITRRGKHLINPLVEVQQQVSRLLHQDYDEITTHL